MASITIEELHAKTGEAVPKAGQSARPTAVTDHGKLVAVLAAPHHYNTGGGRNRTLLPEYAALLASPSKDSVLDDLNAIREDR